MPVRIALVALILGCSSTTVKKTAPGAPQAVAAVAGDGQVTLTWTAADGATAHHVYWRTSPGVSQASASIRSVSSPFTHAGLPNGAPFYYAVSAENEAGEGPLSAEVSATPRPSSYTLTVTKAGQGAGSVTGAGIDCGGACTATHPAGTIVTLTATATAELPFAGWAGCDSSEGATCTVKMTANRIVTAAFDVAPGAPTGLTVTEVASTSARLSWTDNSSGELGFRIAFCDTPAKAAAAICTGDRIADTGPNATTYVLTGLSAMRYHSVSVTAYNAVGESQPARVSFTTSLPPAVALSADTSASHQGLQLAFDADGNGMALWTIYSGGAGHKLVYAGRAAGDEEWSQEQVLIEDDVVYSVALASIERGFVAVWTDGHGAMASRFVKGGWTRPVSLADGSCNEATVVGGGEAAVALWQQYVGGWHLMASFFELGSWGEPVMIDDGASTFLLSGPPSAAANASGYVFAWLQGDDLNLGTSHPVARAYDGALREPVHFGAGDGSVSSVVVAAEPRGGFGMVWIRDYSAVFFARANPDFVWGVSQQLAGGDGWRFQPQIAARESEYAVTWLHWPVGVVATVLACPEDCTISSATVLDTSYGWPHALAAGPAGYAAAFVRSGEVPAVAVQRYEGGAWDARSTTVATGIPDFQPDLACAAAGAGYAVAWSTEPYGAFESAIYDGGWKAAQPLSHSVHDGSARQAMLSANGSGTALASWSQFDHRQWSIFGRFHTRSGGWSDPFTLMGPLGGGQPAYSIATDGAGWAVVSSWSLWLDGLVYEKGRWQSEPLGYSYQQPSIATNGAGYLAAWIDANSGGVRVRFHTTAWDPVPTALYDAPPWVVQVAAASDGRGYAVAWLLDADEDNPGAILARVYDEAGWSDPILLAEGPLDGLRLVGSNDGYVAFWREHENWSLLARRLSPRDGGWVVDAVPTVVASWVNEFRVSGNGSAVVAAVHSSEGIELARYEAGAWRTGLPVDADFFGVDRTPAAAPTPEGAFAAWVRQVDGVDRVFFASCDFRSFGCSPSQAAYDGVAREAEPLVEVSPDGNAIVWTQRSASAPSLLEAKAAVGF